MSSRAVAGVELLAHGARDPDDATRQETDDAGGILVVAGILEMSGQSYKYRGIHAPLAHCVDSLSMILSIGLLGLAVRTLPIGTAYAVWTGIGTLGTAILGIVLFREPATVARMVSITLIVAGIIGVKLSSE